jgi:hypothetical protein
MSVEMELATPEAVTAPYFTRVNEDSLDRLAVMAPYDNKNAPSVWARGNLRLCVPNGQYEPFVVTGPRMRVLFGGCRWNKLVFAMDHNDPACVAFVDWIGKVSDRVKYNIWNVPDKFKPGSKTNARFVFENDIFKTSTEPGIYPDEIRTRIDSRRVVVEGASETVDVPQVDFYKMGYDYSREKVEAHEIRSGGFIIPLISIAYFRNGEKFGLSLTILKGLYQPPEIKNRQNMELDLINVPM